MEIKRGDSLLFVGFECHGFLRSFSHGLNHGVICRLNITFLKVVGVGDTGVTGGIGHHIAQKFGPLPRVGERLRLHTPNIHLQFSKYQAFIFRAEIIRVLDLCIIVLKFL